MRTRVTHSQHKRHLTEARSNQIKENVLYLLSKNEVFMPFLKVMFRIHEHQQLLEQEFIEIIRDNELGVKFS